MQITFYSARKYEIPFFQKFCPPGFEFVFHEAHLNEATAALSKESQAICIFVNDTANAHVLKKLKSNGVKIIALRSSGYNQVDLETAKTLGLKVVRVPAYSPYAVAEHTVALMLSLNRKIHKAFNRVREGNFSLDGLLGFDFHGKTVGLFGTGKIGEATARILKGFGCRLLGYDLVKNPICQELGLVYVSADELIRTSDVISLHCPLVPESKHLINAETISKMKDGVMLINTSRGGLIDTSAVIDGLKSGKIGYLGLDVYEEEADLFFEDLSNTVISDDVFSRLLTFPNVLITGHQAFLTTNALEKIAQTTLQSLQDYKNGGILLNEVKA